MESADTIAAVATAPGRAGVAVVRVSGPDAFAVAARVAGVPAPGSRGEILPSVRHVRFRNPVSGTPLDDGVLLVFAAPRSYTGEDVAELQCHGGAVAPRRVLEACLAAGARLARRGEFTERAYLNGKLDYDQASGVLALVDALTDRAADAAMEGASGAAARALRALYDRALALSATIEHALDVSEEELPEGFVRSIADSVEELRGQTRAEIVRAREGRMLRDGAKVVLAGPPNVGKSSLFNALVGSARAIVSDRPGTTRDAIEAWIDIAGWPVCLVDTAGLRTAADAVEAEGVERAKSLAAASDIILDLHDAQPAVLSEETADLPRKIVVLTKCDLLPAGDRPQESVGTDPKIGGDRPQGLVGTDPEVVAVSAVTGEGIERLKGVIAERLAAKAEGVGEVAGDARADRLCEIEGILARVPSGDLVLAANAVRDAASRLGAMIGAEYSADMLEALFSRFCVGK
ncbi:MAG: tRNA modification GTPase [Kiritimatiellae bacterium]|nr:tRNA modification GTPase [Kiritimatiellia bacterium]